MITVKLGRATAHFATMEVARAEVHALRERASQAESLALRLRREAHKIADTLSTLSKETLR